MSDVPELIHGPLEDRHRELGASFAEFGGWLMPVSYAGTVSEHNATRTAVGLFDVSHLGKALVRGPGAAQFVNSALTNDLGRIGPGKAQYTLCCTESGGVIDDLIAYYVSDDEIFLVPNAANTAAVVGALQAAAPGGLSITNLHRSYAVLAVQGPCSTDVLTALGLPTEMDYMGYADASYSGVPVRVCRTGYTGEHGYELLPPWESAGVVFDALLAAVSAAGGEPAGLGARDTLRTEMGYPLHGHELSLDISPLPATGRGLRAAAEAGVRLAFVCAVDMPYLTVELIEDLARRAVQTDAEVVLPWDGRNHYLAAVYRTDLADRVDTLVGAGERKMSALVDASDALRIVMADSRPLTNVNSAAGLHAPMQPGR